MLAVKHVGFVKLDYRSYCWVDSWEVEPDLEVWRELHVACQGGGTCGSQ